MEKKKLSINFSDSWEKSILFLHKIEAKKKLPEALGLAIIQLCLVIVFFCCCCCCLDIICQAIYDGQAFS